jgi:hypothetical protein
LSDGRFTNNGNKNGQILSKKITLTKTAQRVVVGNNKKMHYGKKHCETFAKVK